MTLKQVMKGIRLPSFFIKAMNKFILLSFYAEIRLNIGAKKQHLPSFDDAWQTLNRIHSAPGESITTESQHLSLQTEKYAVSVIVPCYNVEKYIRDCIESLMKQDLKESYEVIFVNDGSTDDTLKILQTYGIPSNWKIINQSNGGLSAARNTGIEAARGQFIFFLDSDDLLPDSSLSSLWLRAKNDDVDVVVGNIVRLENSEKAYYHLENEIMDLNGRKISLSLPGMVPGALFKRTLWENIRFPIGYLFEDTCLLYLVMPLVGRVETVNEAVYLYRSNPDGLSKSKVSPRVIDTVYIVPKMLESAKTLDIDISRLQELTVRQISLFVYERLRGLEDPEVLPSAFSVVRGCFKKYYPIMLSEHSNPYSLAVEQALYEDDYWLWEKASRSWLMEEKIQQLR